MMKTWALVAVAAMGLTACQNDIDEQIEVKDSVVVTFVTDSAESRTSVDTEGDKPVFSWDDSGETFKVLEQTNNSFVTATDVVFEKDEESGLATIKATFAANAGWNGYSYVTIHPEGGIDMEKSATINLATLNLPENQYMYEVGTYDSDADLMVSEVVESDVQPTEAQSVRFTRLGAVVKMTLKEFNLEEGDKIEKVIFTADGKALAGQIKTDLDDPHNFTAVEDAVSSSVTININDYSDNEIFFVTLPTVLEAGDTYTVTVLTNKYLYVKQGKIPAEKELKLGVGAVNRIGVNMSGVNPSDKWVLVKDATKLKEGDVVTIAAKNYDYAIGKQGGNYPLASQTSVVKVGDYLYHPIATAETSVDNRIQHYTLMQRDVNKVSFDFYNASDYTDDPSVGFVLATGSNYSPKLQSYPDVNTLFDVTIDDNNGVATICASGISGSNKWWRYSHNASTPSSRKFDCTSSAPTGNYQICIYKLEGADEGFLPDVEAVITPADVVISEDAAETATPIDDVVCNYVGKWSIGVEDDAEWLNVEYDAEKNCLTYTAEANSSSEERVANVTITATKDEKSVDPWTFKVTQKSAAVEISIAEFIKLGQDFTTKYKITGKLTEIPDSASGTFKLADENGNIAQIKYLYIDCSDDYAKDEVDMEVGDVVTVTAVVTATTASSACGSKTYRSIYKGHYGIKASAGLAASYEGGDVNITVTPYSNGSIVTPTEIEGSMPASEFAEFTYSGGDTATVTFTSENTTSDAREATVTFTYGATSVEVTVEQGINPANKIGFELVTDASTLAVGDEVIIVAKNADKALGCPTSTSQTTSPAVAIEKTGTVIYDAEEAGVQVLTLGQGVSEGTMSFDFTYNVTGYRLHNSSGKFKIRATSYAVNAVTSWTININEDDGTVKIFNEYSSSNYHIKFNSATSTTFTLYKEDSANETKADNAVCIYKKQTKNAE